MVKQVYKALLKAYGRQGWWPVTPVGGTAPRYSGGPNNDKQALEVMIGAVLTQNTSWKNVEKALAALSAKGLIDAAAILKAHPASLASLIRSSGYFNQKAKKLKALALFLHGRPLASLRHMRIPQLRTELLGIHGVGPETADSIILYALKKSIFVVDAYTRRVFERLGLIRQGLSYEEIQAVFESALPRSVPLFNEYHALIVAHAKDICRKRPDCTHCVLKTLCRQASGRTDCP